MAIVGNMLNSALDAGTEKSSVNLESFLKEMTDSQQQGIGIKIPDVKNTFEIKFKFFPNSSDESSKKKGFLSTIESSAKGMVRNLANNLTGGILGSIKNDVDIKKKMEEWYANESQAKKESFLEYLAVANLLSGSDDTWFGGAGKVSSPLNLNLTYFVQDITIPNISIDTSPATVQYLGQYGGTMKDSLFLKTDTNTLAINVIKTQVPIVERIFYPWMREVTMPEWCYATEPYTTARVEIDLTSHCDIKFIFVGVRPHIIGGRRPNMQLNTEITQSITFFFDAMFIHSKLKTNIGSIMDSVKGLIGSASNVLKL